MTEDALTSDSQPFVHQVLDPNTSDIRGRELREQGMQVTSRYRDPVAVDMARGVLNAPTNLAASVVGFGNSLVGSPLGEVGEPDIFGKPNTLAGGLTQGVSQFAIDMWLTAGAFKTLGLAKKIEAVKYGKALLPVAEGAVADLTAFPGTNGRLSDLLWAWGDQHPSLRNSVTDFLRSKENDSDLEGRMKNVFEGFGLGAVTGMAIKALKLFKATKGGEEAAVKALSPQDLEAIKKHAAELEPEIEAFMSGERSFPTNVSENTAKAVFMRIGNLTAEQAEGALAPLKAFAESNKVSLTEALQNRISLYRKSFEDYKASDIAAKTFLGSGEPAHVSRAADLFAQAPHAKPGTAEWGMLAERVKAWLSPWTSNANSVAVKSFDDLKTLYRVLGANPQEAADKILLAAKESLGSNNAKSLQKILDSGELRVGADDLRNPTGTQNFGLARRLADVSERLSAAELKAEALAANAKAATEARAQGIADRNAAAAEEAVTKQKTEKLVEEAHAANAKARDDAKLAAMNARQEIQSNRLWQHMDEFPAAAKGVTDFVNDGKAIITFFEKADASTFIHELSHVVRRWMPEAEVRNLAEKLGVKDWQNWSRAEEEQFANLLTDKILLGKSANAQLDAMVSRSAKLMSRVYTNLRESAVGGTVNPSIKEAFEKDALGAQVPLNSGDKESLKVAGKLIADSIDKGEPLDKSLAANGINLFHYDANDSVLSLMGTVSKFVEEHVAPNLKNVQNREWVVKQAAEQAQQLGMSTDAYVARMGEVAGKTGKLPIEIAKSRLLLSTVVQDFSDAAAAAANTDSTDALLRVVKAKDQLLKAMTFYRETSRNISRSLGIFQADVRALDRVEQLERIVQEGGAGKVRDLVDEVNRINKLTPEADKLPAIRNLLGNRFWGTVIELRQGSMLGAGAGFVADVVSNAFKTASLPFTRAIAAGYIGDTKGIHDALAIYKAMGNHIFTSWKAFKASLDRGSPVLDRSTKYEYPQYIKASTYGLQGSPVGAAIDVIGKAVRLAPTLRMSADEFFKTLNYRSFLESQFTRQALEMGLKGDDLNAFVRSNLLNSVDETGRGVVTPAVRYAEEATFSTPHVDDLAAKVIAAANEHQWLKLIVPFIKTPVNLFSDTVAHTPLIGALIKEQRTALGKGLASEEARQVYAKWTLGGSLIAATTYMWMAGHITGRGSSDPKVQEQLRLSGWQPYSFVYTGSDGKKKYIGFNRIEPWGSIAGIVSDFADLASTSYNEHKLDLEQAAVHMAAAVSRNALNKTYLKGIADFVDAMSQPDKNLERYVASVSGSFVPAGLRAFDNDPYIREAQGVLDGIKRRVPGWNQTLMPKRNILGEPVKGQEGWMLPDNISPFAYSESINDPVKNELSALASGLTNPNPVRWGVDYREFTDKKGQTAYDRLLELTGTVKGGDGKSLSQALNQLIGTNEYKALVKGGESAKSFRVSAVTNLLSKYRTLAEESLMKERPDLNKAVNTGRTQKAQAGFAAIQRAQLGQ